MTGSGPHAGDADAKRNGLDPLQMSQVHADLVFLLVGLTVGLLLAVIATQRSAAVRRAPSSCCSSSSWPRALIGFVQYFTDLPVVLVGFHMLGAAIISATVTWALLEVREG